MAGIGYDPPAGSGSGAVTSVATRIGDVVLTAADVGAGTFPGNVVFAGTVAAPEFTASGLTGATGASRYVGATASGAPASGTFAVGDFIVDQRGLVWVCTTAGTPGTWKGIGAERALMMGKAGAIGATETDAADFMLVVPFDMTLLRMKVSLKAAASGAMVVQLRKATATITTPPTYADVSGWTCTFVNGNVLATNTPSSTTVSEGDALGFSVATGSGTGMQVELVGTQR